MTRNQIEYSNLVETKRANQAKEQQARDELAETTRSHRKGESLQSQSIAETVRSNRAREYETNRANVAKETETNRSNVAKEDETRRANVAKETETSRSNRANEAARTAELVETTAYDSGKLALRGAQLAQRTAHDAGTLAETIRHNTVMELKPDVAPSVNVTTGDNVLSAPSTGGTRPNRDVIDVDVTEIPVRQELPGREDPKALKPGVHWDPLWGVWADKPTPSLPSGKTAKQQNSERRDSNGSKAKGKTARSKGSAEKRKR